jgi:hypothetical protein
VDTAAPWRSTGRSGNVTGTLAGLSRARESRRAGLRALSARISRRAEQLALIAVVTVFPSSRHPSLPRLGLTAS